MTWQVVSTCKVTYYRKLNFSVYINISLLSKRAPSNNSKVIQHIGSLSLYFCLPVSLTLSLSHSLSLSHVRPIQQKHTKLTAILNSSMLGEKNAVSYHHYVHFGHGKSVPWQLDPMQHIGKRHFWWNHSTGAKKFCNTNSLRILIQRQKFLKLSSL